MKNNNNRFGQKILIPFLRGIREREGLQELFFPGKGLISTRRK